MDFSSLLQSFETGRVMQYLGQLDTQQLIENPFLLGGIGALALISLLLRWRMVLVSLMAVTGFVWLVHYVQQRGTGISETSADNLLLFAGGGIVLIGLVIYQFFLKSD